MMGETVRTVGVISQTIQCVRQGRVSGNIHLHAKVVRDLYNLYDVDCIASIKTFTRLVGKGPVKPPDDAVLSLDGDDGEDDIVHADEGEEKNVPADEGEEKNVPADEGEDNIDTRPAKDKDEDNPDVNPEDVTIGDIPWNYGYSPVPTVDELWPEDTPEDNARWYKELHQPRPKTPPRKNIGNKKYKFKTNISTEDEKFCKLCFHEGSTIRLRGIHASRHETISC